MTRTPRRESDGKPLPTPPRPPEEIWGEEPTVRIERPSAEDLDQELALHAEAGQGPTTTTHRKGPR